MAKELHQYNSIESVELDMLVLRAYQFLVERAGRGLITNYEQVATHLGLPTHGNQLGAGVSPILGKVFQWCVQRNQPHLTSLVVRKSGADMGIPGNGFWELLELTRLNRQERREWTTRYQRIVFCYYHGLVEVVEGVTA